MLLGFDKVVCGQIAGDTCGVRITTQATAGLPSQDAVRDSHPGTVWAHTSTEAVEQLKICMKRGKVIMIKLSGMAVLPCCSSNYYH